MKNLHSIQTADRIFTTGGSHPVLLPCNDRKDYVCKYNMSSGSAKRLMCEYIGASFLKLWGLNVPEFAFISVNRDHIPSDYKIHGYYFDTTCFGLYYSKSFIEINNFTAEISYQKRKFYPNRKDLWDIALFDIWLANEDRHAGNYNLLIDIDNQRNFIPIDHEKIFNSGTMNNPICELTFDESIINSPLFTNLFSKKEFNKKSISDLKKNFEGNVKHCRNNCVKIIDKIPTDWKIDQNILKDKLLSEIFDDSWLKTSFHLFLDYYKQSIYSK